MTPTPTSPAWDTMTHAERVEWLAVNIMGWEKRKARGWRYDYVWVQPGKKGHRANWDPLSDHNHWRQVEERVAENGVLFDNMVYEMRITEQPSGSWALAADHYIKSDLRTRACALFTAFQSLA